jgi:hypothetical protein
MINSEAQATKPVITALETKLTTEFGMFLLLFIYGKKCENTSLSQL